MNNIVRSVLKTASYSCVPNFLKPCVVNQNISRNMRHLTNQVVAGNRVIKYQYSLGCSSGLRYVNTQTNVSGEKELVEFLAEEIITEKSIQKSSTIPSQIDGFQVHLDGSDITLEKKTANEEIIISFNVNHSVVSTGDEMTTEDVEKGDFNDMKSLPSFNIDIKRGNSTLNFSCSFVQDPEPNEEGYVDLFGIDEICLYEGEWKETNYSASGDVLDSYLYDLLLNYLEEKGISSDFVEKLSELSSNYEHTSYINFLQDLQKFASKK